MQILTGLAVEPLGFIVCVAELKPGHSIGHP